MRLPPTPTPHAGRGAPYGLTPVCGAAAACLAAASSRAAAHDPRGARPRHRKRPPPCLPHNGATQTRSAHAARAPIVVVWFGGGAGGSTPVRFSCSAFPPPPRFSLAECIGSVPQGEGRRGKGGTSHSLPAPGWCWAATPALRLPHPTVPECQDRRLGRCGASGSKRNPGRQHRAPPHHHRSCPRGPLSDGNRRPWRTRPQPCHGGANLAAGVRRATAIAPSLAQRRHSSRAPRPADVRSPTEHSGSGGGGGGGAAGMVQRRAWKGDERGGWGRARRAYKGGFHVPAVVVAAQNTPASARTAPLTRPHSPRPPQSPAVHCGASSSPPAPLPPLPR